jgi:hypothetical protein
MPNDPIFKATIKSTGEVIWIDDLYWFEENGIHDMSGDEEAEAYMDANFMSRDWYPVEPLVDAEGRRLRPRLELVGSPSIMEGQGTLHRS